MISMRVGKDDSKTMKNQETNSRGEKKNRKKKQTGEIFPEKIHETYRGRGVSGDVINGAPAEIIWFFILFCVLCVSFKPFI